MKNLQYFDVGSIVRKHREDLVLTDTWNAYKQNLCELWEEGKCSLVLDIHISEAGVMAHVSNPRNLSQEESLKFEVSLICIGRPCLIHTPKKEIQINIYVLSQLKTRDCLFQITNIIFLLKIYFKSSY